MESRLERILKLASELVELQESHRSAFARSSQVVSTTDEIIAVSRRPRIPQDGVSQRNRETGGGYGSQAGLPEDVGSSETEQLLLGVIERVDVGDHDHPCSYQRRNAS
ncbi:hypothetical protein L596_024437 [Steinernema carpocapsae]|uniref:Uncharacterized protein n=1 Tax=Steinernema carpocapsae TaxID=34508 RepID=A0A4U5MGS2_STECR|nr:hypothetical protein L596_024437 [Steinernema carpocapsae]